MPLAMGMGCCFDNINHESIYTGNKNWNPVLSNFIVLNAVWSVLASDAIIQSAIIQILNMIKGIQLGRT